ncbi:MAG TPA: hypothetical protein VKN63_02955 [Afifellaceae bacterium]|nr:hypothetical protein [Afifellaceae bacterium]
MLETNPPDARLVSRRLAGWWTGLPQGWFLKRLFHVMIVACIGGMVLDAVGALPGGEQALPGEPAEPNPVFFPRPAPGDNARPYRPDMVPKPSPDRTANPRLPDGTPIGRPQLQRMEFTYDATDDDVPYIVATGDVAVGTSEEFKRFYDSNGSNARYVFLSSRGGIVQEAVEIGRFIRTNEIKTIVPKEAFCFSACPLILAGGVERVVYPDAWVGLHQSRIAEVSGGNIRDAFEHGQTTVSRMMDYVESMDVDPIVWRRAIQTPHEEIFMLSNEELEETRLATVVSDNVRLK